MKHILKKIGSAGTALLITASMTAAGAGLVWAEDQSYESQIVEYVGGLTESIIGFSEEEIAGYMASGDEFTMNAMQAWTSAKNELGDLSLAEINQEAAEYETTDDGYSVTVPVAFEKLNADFVYQFTEEGPVSLSVNVNYPMSLTLQRAGLNTLMGIGTVFVMLVFLSFVISLFRFVPVLTQGKKKAQQPAPAPVPAAVPVQEPVVEEETDDTELIAVIAAAIAASEGTSPDGFVVRSIRKVNRRKW